MATNDDLRYLLTPRAAVIVPAGQAAVTAVAVAVTVGSLAWYFDKPNPAALSGLAMGVTFGAAWLLNLSFWRDRVAGAPALATPAMVYPMTIKAQVIASDPSGAYLAGIWADFSIPIERLARAAKRIEAGVGFSHAGLAGPHRPLSRAEFESFRDTCIARGLAYWKNPSAHGVGCDLTLAGRALMRRLAELPTHKDTLPQPERILPGKLDFLPRLHAHTRTHTREEALISPYLYKPN